MGVRLGPGLPGGMVAGRSAVPSFGEGGALHADPFRLVEAGPADGPSADGATEVGRLPTMLATTDEMPAQGIRLLEGKEPVVL